MTPAPDTGRTAEEMREALATVVLDTLIEWQAVTPGTTQTSNVADAVADAMIVGPLAELIAENDRLREQNRILDIMGETGFDRMMRAGEERDAAQAEIAQLRSRLLEAEQGAEAMRGALDQAEACLSIVKPRSDKAEYLRTLGVVRAALNPNQEAGDGSL